MVTSVWVSRGLHSPSKKMIVRVKLFLMRGRDQVREAFWRYEAHNVQFTTDFSWLLSLLRY